MLRPRGSKQGQGLAPAIVQHTWPRRGSDPGAAGSTTSGRSPLQSCRLCLLAPLAPHSPAATGHGQGLWLAALQPQPGHGQAQGCHGHRQQGMENRDSLWPPALLWDGVNPSVLRRRGDSLITDLGREVGPWKGRLGHRLQRPGGVTTAFLGVPVPLNVRAEKGTERQGARLTWGHPGVFSLVEHQGGERGATAGSYRALGAPA